MSQTIQRGSGWSIALVFWFYKIFGYKFIYMLMYPVTFFYFLFASNVKASLKIYYKNLGIKFTSGVYYEHLRLFANCMVDRFISKISPQSYTFTCEDMPYLTNELSKGCVLVLSHFGGWAVASNSAKVNNRIHVVMKEALLEQIKRVENSLKLQNKNIQIIDLNEGGVSSFVKITNALMDNEVVAMMGDRASGTTKEVKFLGLEAGFNKSPFQVAYKLKKPIMLFFSSHVSMQNYHVEFLKIDMNFELNEEEAIEEAMGRYVEFYEKILRENPTQWFNFYNFWG